MPNADLPVVDSLDPITSAGHNALVTRVNGIDPGVRGQALTLTNGWATAVPAVAPLRVNRSGPLVLLQGYANGGTAPLIGWVPAGFRPAAAVLVIAVANAAGTVTLRECTIGTDGAVTLAAGTAASSWVSLSAVWLAA